MSFLRFWPKGCRCECLQSQCTNWVVRLTAQLPADRDRGMVSSAECLPLRQWHRSIDETAAVSGQVRTMRALMTKRHRLLLLLDGPDQLRNAVHGFSSCIQFMDGSFHVLPMIDLASDWYEGVADIYPGIVLTAAAKARSINDTCCRKRLLPRSDHRNIPQFLTVQNDSVAIEDDRLKFWHQRLVDEIPLNDCRIFIAFSRFSHGTKR